MKARTLILLTILLNFNLLIGCKGKLNREKEQKEEAKLILKQSLDGFIKKPNFSNLIFISDDGERKDILKFKDDGKTVIWDLSTKYGNNQTWSGRYSIDLVNSTISFDFPTSMWFHSINYKLYKDSVPWDSQNPFITLEGLTNEETQKSLRFYGPKDSNGENDITVLNR
jgi:hypothetical protein